MSASGDAVYQIEDNLCTMRFERTIDRPVEAVWAALTEPEQLATWFFPIQGTIAAGATIIIPWEEPWLTSTVVAYEPPRLLAWTWHQPGEPESTVRWELFPAGDATRFVLTHTLPVLGPREPTDTLAGWQEHVDLLVDCLHGNERDWSTETWRALKDRYAFEIEKRLLPGNDGISETVNGQRQVRFARILRAPLARVWDAIGTAEGLSGWFTPIELDHDASTITFDFTAEGYSIYTYPLLKFEPPRLIEFQFDDHELNVVRFELFDGGDTTLFVLTNRFGPNDDLPDHQSGWHYHLDRLPSHLAGEPDPRPDGYAKQLAARYHELASAR